MKINPRTDTNYLTLDLIRLILINELCIPSDRIDIYNQKFNLSKKQGLYIYIEYRVPPNIISSRNKMDVNNNENQDSNWLEEITIGVYSRNLEALRRKEEVAMSLHSIYSQQLQEAQSFKVFRNPRIVPVNEIEGPARLYRFDVECKVQSWYSKIKVAEFFNSFNVSILAEGGSPIQEVEFVIPATNPTMYPK